MFNFLRRDLLMLIPVAGLLLFLGNEFVKDMRDHVPLLPGYADILRAEAQQIATQAAFEAQAAASADAYGDTSPYEADAHGASPTGEIETTTVETSFDACKLGIVNVATQFGTTPSIIASDNTVHMVRFRTTDGSVIATCSAADGRMALTRSPY